MTTLVDVLRPEITGVPGVPESVLPHALLAELPDAVPGAPWEVRCSGALWVGRGGRAARTALPPTLRDGRALVVGGAVLRYTSSPVGPYDEVLGVVGTRDGVSPVGTVVFMAVDSPASLVGGRTAWGMPKSLAAFSGGPRSQRFVATGAGGSWLVFTRTSPFGPTFPVSGRLVARQQLADGRVADSALSGKASARLAVVTVEVESQASLPTWLRPGRHLGLALEWATLKLSEPGVR